MEHWTLPYLMACWREAIRYNPRPLAYFANNCPDEQLKALADRIIGRHNRWICYTWDPVKKSFMENYIHYLHKQVLHIQHGNISLARAQWNRQVCNDERHLLEYSKQLIEKGGC